MDMRLEVAVVPAADVDRAKNFCKALGWREDTDRAGGIHRCPDPSSSSKHLRGSGGR